VSDQDTWRRPRPASRRTRRSPRRVAVRALLAASAAGPLVGLLWWATTPGGFRSPGASYLDLVQAAGAADAGLAVACLLAGAVAGVGWVLLREESHDARAVARLVGLLVGGLLGGLLAWGTGSALQVLVPPQVGDLPADVVADAVSPHVNLAVVAGVLLWPLTTGVLVTVDTLRELFWQALSRDDG
jgi:hypothetical protein